MHTNGIVLNCVHASFHETLILGNTFSIQMYAIKKQNKTLDGLTKKNGIEKNSKARAR